MTILTDKFLETLKYEGAVSLISWGAEAEPHATGTWISYLALSEDEKLLAPAAGMYHLEADIAKNDKLFLMLGVREVEGRNGYQGIGFRLTVKAKLIGQGSTFETVHQKYPFARQALEMTPLKLEQLL